MDDMCPRITYVKSVESDTRHGNTDSRKTGMAKRKANALGSQSNCPPPKKPSLQAPTMVMTREDRLESNKSRAREFAVLLAAKAREQGIFEGDYVPFELQDEVLVAYKHATHGKNLMIPGHKARYHPDTGERIYPDPDKHAAKLAKKDPHAAERFLARADVLKAEAQLARETTGSRAGLKPRVPHDESTQFPSSQYSGLHTGRQTSQAIHLDTASDHDGSPESDPRSVNPSNSQSSVTRSRRSDFAQREMAQWGYEKGSGLGKDASGITDPVEIRPRPRLAGIGADALEAESIIEAAKWLYEATKQNVTKQNGNVSDNVDHSGQPFRFSSPADPFTGLRQDEESGDSIDFEDACNDMLAQTQARGFATGIETYSHLPGPPENRNVRGHELSSKSNFAPQKPRPSKREREQQRLLETQASTIQTPPGTTIQPTIYEIAKSQKPAANVPSNAGASPCHQQYGNETEQSELTSLALALLARQDASLVPKFLSAMDLRTNTGAISKSQIPRGLRKLPTNFMTIDNLCPLGADVLIDDEFLVRSGTSRKELEEELLEQRKKLVSAFLHSARSMTQNHLVIPEHQKREQRHLLANGQIRETYRVKKSRMICHRIELVLNGVDPTAFAPPTGLPDKDLRYSDGTQYVHLSRKHAESIGWQPLGVVQAQEQAQEQAQAQTPDQTQSTKQSDIEQIAKDLTKKFGGLWYRPPPMQRVQGTDPKSTEQRQPLTSFQQVRVPNHIEQAKPSSTVYSEVYGASVALPEASSSTLQAQSSTKWTPPSSGDTADATRSSTNLTSTQLRPTAPSTDTAKGYVPPHMRDAALAKTSPDESSTGYSRPHLRGTAPLAAEAATWNSSSLRNAAVNTISNKSWVPPSLRGVAPLVNSSTAWVPPHLRSSMPQHTALHSYRAVPPPMDERQAAALSRWGREDASLAQAAVPALPVPKPTKEYLASTLSKTFRSDGTQPLLIICDLNGTLLFRNKGLKTSFKKRPGLTRFLNYIFSHHKVMVWTSARPHNMVGITEKLFTPEQQAACVKLWARDTLGLTRQQYQGHPQVYKCLETVWRDKTIQQTNPYYKHGGRWSQKNTILIDDSPLKTIGQPHNAINVPELVASLLAVEEKTALLRQVEAYIEEARHYDNISAFFRRWPFTADGRWWSADKAGADDQDDTRLVREESMQIDEPEGSPRR